MDRPSGWCYGKGAGTIKNSDDVIAAITDMAAPALVATDVTAGRHTIRFRYHGFAGYPVLFAISALTLVAFAGTGVKRVIRRRSRAAR